MKSKFFIALLSLLLFSFLGFAQKKKQTAKSPKPKKAQTTVSPEEARAQEMFQDMLQGTAQLVVVDSQRVDLEDLAQSLSLPSSSGGIMRYGDFFKDSGSQGGFLSINEFRNKCYFSLVDDKGKHRLYSSDRLMKTWSKAQLINDFGEEFQDIQCPYMMPDGVTLYFAAHGEHSLGGLDIFVTMFDTDSMRFLKPENIGLPYNSTADDWFCITDEMNNLGYLVTSRFQPTGKATIYTYVPSTERWQDTNGMSAERLTGLALLSRMSDTWGTGNERQAALERIAAVKKRQSGKAKTGDIDFFVNDDVTYHSKDEFQKAESRTLYEKLETMKANIKEAESALSQLREHYNKAPNKDKAALRSSILSNEKAIERLRTTAHETEKSIRNLENR